MPNPLIIYHGGCRDGFCAAWIARRYFSSCGIECDFFPANYGQPAPDCKHRDVIIVDFSYPIEAMKKIIDEAMMVTVLDHHKTAKEVLEPLTKDPPSNVTITFDMERSGAQLAQNHFFPSQKNWIADYVEDRDLWRFRLPDSKAINAYLSTIPQTFKAWDKAERAGTFDAIMLGKAVLAKTEAYVAEVRKNAIKTLFEGYVVPIVNAPQVDISELVGALALGSVGEDGEPDGKHTPPFAMGWFQRSDGWFQYSLRSRGDFDVAALAKKYGGGGHKNAAGFQTAKMIHEFLRPASES